MKIGIPKEIYPGECRVSATPEAAVKLKKLGFSVLVESSAGENASFSDESYQDAHCQIIADTHKLWSESDIILKVRPPQKSEIAYLKDNQTIISFIWPHQNKDLLDQLKIKKINVIAMDAIPRISRAQKMDALSSMANIAGYRAIVEAAGCFGRFFTGQITAAGKVPPAKVLVIGAGVAGLAAIGAARSLGAIVRAFDTRPAVKDQVKSMGAEFLEVTLQEDGTGEGGYAKVMSPEFIEAEMKLFSEQARDVDIIITTALIPGKPAPTLITEDMVRSMKPGSVIVDLAAEQGGNCALTQKDKVAIENGVSIIGYTDLPSRMAPVASNLYSNNLIHLLDDLGGAEQFHLDLEDDVVRGSLIIHQGRVIWPPTPIKTPPPQKPVPVQKDTSVNVLPVQKPQKSKNQFWLFITGCILLSIGWFADADFLNHFTVFVLSCIIGWQVIWNVSPALHTPLMSVTNAVSGIIILGGLLQISPETTSPAVWLGMIAIFVATINIVGGFLVTSRMLKMFRRDS